MKKVRVNDYLDLDKFFKEQNKKVKLAISSFAILLLLFLSVAILSPFKNKIFSTLFPKYLSRAATITDWNQIAHDPEHSGYSPETLGTNIKVAWTYPFQPDRVFPQVQAIAYNDGSGTKIFVGTEGANGQPPALYAIWGGTTAQNPNAGKVAWKYTVGGPILSSAAADNGLVYVVAMDGVLYGIHTSDGSLAFKDQLSSLNGFRSSPIVGDNKVLVGGEDGYLYAVDPVTGSLIWKTNLGAPILQTPAYDSGKIFVGTMDMYVYALNTADGSQSWKSSRIHGISFREYYPVVTGGKVIVVAEGTDTVALDGISPGYPFGMGPYNGNSTFNSWYSANVQYLTTGNATQAQGFTSSQDTVMQAFNTNPSSFNPTVTVIDENTGQSPPSLQIPHFDVQQHNGSKPPPCVLSNGNIITPVQFFDSGWGMLNPSTQRFVNILFDATDYSGKSWSLNANGTDPAGFGQDDEDMFETCSANLVLASELFEENSNFTGFFNLSTWKWTEIGPGWTNGQMGTNTQSGGMNGFSISNTMIYHIVFNELITRSTQ